mmetsp:Transcript_124598/g.363811  ORF Transcript_124598/g.363811 Transcript_124598/m.363811 type:complete len:262 (+) Transcript_124598:185-970(+)
MLREPTAVAAALPRAGAALPLLLAGGPSAAGRLALGRGELLQRSQQGSVATQCLLQTAAPKGALSPCCVADGVRQARASERVAKPDYRLHLLPVVLASSLTQRLHEALRQPRQKAAHTLALLGCRGQPTCRCGRRDLHGRRQAHGSPRCGRRLQSPMARRAGRAGGCLLSRLRTGRPPRRRLLRGGAPLRGGSACTETRTGGGGRVILAQERVPHFVQGSQAPEQLQHRGQEVHARGGGAGGARRVLGTLLRQGALGAEAT